MKEEVEKQLIEVVGKEQVYLEEPMKKHTTFRIGGPAQYYLVPKSTEEIQRVLHICKQENIPFFILGNGSNLLVSDQGYRGAILQIYKNLSGVEVVEERLIVKAGMLLSQVANIALKEELAGFAFAAGIPGTLGGAIVMNAGAYGGEMKDIIESVTVLNERAEICTLQAPELEFGYRTSIIKERGYVVLEAVIHLQKGKKEVIQKEMDELREKRVSRQPLEYPSAGSTFKRPEGYFAGKLIMDAGLQGFGIGGAEISTKHCGFVINAGEATAADVVELMKQVSKRVQEKFGVCLEPEVKFLGEFEQRG